MTVNNTRRRRWKSRLATGVMAAMVLLSLLPLASVSWSLLAKGWAPLTRSFFMHLPIDTPPGIGNAILGTLLILLFAALMAVPVGLLVGIYLANRAASRLAATCRTTLDVMSGIPALVVGMFVYTLVVRRFGFSLLAGSLSLALIMLPIFARTTEEALKAIPTTVNEAGLALGLPRRRVILRIVLRSAMPSVLTGLFLALARVGGEAAPLLFTASGSFYWPSHSLKAIATLQPLRQQSASLPYLIYEYAKDPDPAMVNLAWGAALLLVAMILSIRLSTNLLNRWRYGQQGTSH